MKNLRVCGLFLLVFLTGLLLVGLGIGIGISIEKRLAARKLNPRVHTSRNIGWGTITDKPRYDSEANVWVLTCCIGENDGQSEAVRTYCTMVQSKDVRMEELVAGDKVYLIWPLGYDVPVCFANNVKSRRDYLKLALAKTSKSRDED